MAQRSAPAPFLTKTYQLVEEESTDDVVSWNESGTAFVVWKTADFARDLLPSYFKHNNFSSFVRQLNTYGFRKVVPDKWEFANDCFRRGQRELLDGIRRRKAGKGKGGVESPSNSGEDLGSTSTSSSPVEYVGENEKLRKENESLRWELEQSTKRCEELIAFLTEYMKVEPEQIDRIMRQGTIRDGDDEGGQSVKLFGVWVKGKDKRGRDEKTGCAGPHPKEMKMTTVDFHGTMKVCN